MLGILTVPFCWAFACQASAANHKFHVVPGKCKCLHQAESHFMNPEHLPFWGLTDC